MNGFVLFWFLWGKPMKSLSLRDHSLGCYLSHNQLANPKVLNRVA
ncbi:hypothetical protein N204_04780 [Helicobacter pylori UM085]|nr:hypothetical protein N204_04780 [Helicobacter pylori UM085]EQL54409.1 hypothetical protein N404_02100 [Helicobacter pylori FD506]